ncbi:Protein FAM3C [Manis javanica]|nr:CAMPATH-1 antigen [Manis javanica]KAI5947015.1 Protein FAM3C [Manis javanica]
MKGCLLFLFTISLLVTIKIQTGVLGNMTTPRAMENTVRTTKKPMKSGAPTLSSLGSGSVLIFLTNTLIQLFYLS